MAVQKHELDAKSLAITGGILGFITGLLGAVFHGGFGMQTMFMMRQGFMWSNPMNSGYAVVAFTIVGVFYGWLFAVVYNYVIKNF